MAEARDARLDAPRVGPTGRERIRQAAMDLVLAHGYGAPTVEMVVERAGIERAEFERHFTSLEDCCLQIYVENIVTFDEVVFGAFERPGPWRDRVRAAAYALVRFLSDHPRNVRFDVVAMSSAGTVPRVHRERQLQRLVDLVDFGRRELDDPASMSRSVAECVVGSVYELVVGKLQGGLAEGAAEGIVPDVMYVVLRPYLGHEVAMEEFTAAPRYRPPVSKREPSEEDSAPSLARLPPGRHGLPREFVTENQRGRITAGIISVVAERGYHETTISQIAAAAGVSRRTFYAHYSSKQECFFDAYDQIATHLHMAGEEAAVPYSAWPDRVAAKLRSVLEVFAANPDLVRFHLIEAPRAGDEIAARYRLGTVRALGDLIVGKPRTPDLRQPSEAIEYAVVGGMAALIADRVLGGEGDRLTGLLPDLLELVLTPYLGREEAVRIARSASA